DIAARRKFGRMRFLGADGCASRSGLRIAGTPENPQVAIERQKHGGATIGLDAWQKPPVALVDVHPDSECELFIVVETGSALGRPFCLAERWHQHVCQ